LHCSNCAFTNILNLDRFFTAIHIKWDIHLVIWAGENLWNSLDSFVGLLLSFSSSHRSSYSK
ncbi:MAG: hypothetical protein KAW66_12110, partial [Candidatus Lokiarchaeota archaeon]|nr:hypothetical protein [Candidatus Lokiarchaeota archaeon]